MSTNSVGFDTSAVMVTAVSTLQFRCCRLQYCLLAGDLHQLLLARYVFFDAATSCCTSVDVDLLVATTSSQLHMIMCCCNKFAWRIGVRVQGVSSVSVYATIATKQIQYRSGE